MDFSFLVLKPFPYTISQLKVKSFCLVLKREINNCGAMLCAASQVAAIANEAVGKRFHQCLSSDARKKHRNAAQRATFPKRRNEGVFWLRQMQL